MQVREEALARIDGWTQSVQCIFMECKPRATDAPLIPHFHEYIELLYGIRDDAEVLVGDRWYPMHPGDLVVINARQVHEVITRSRPARYLVVKFLPEVLYAQGQSLAGLRYLLPLWQKEMQFSPVMAADELARSGIDVFLQDMVREFADRHMGYELAIQADILKLFTWILRTRCPQPDPRPAELSPDLQLALHRALRLAQEHYADWTVRDAARACGLSYSYFSRSFKQLFSISFCTYLERLRLLEAERLLLTTGSAVGEIALETGFGTASYFTQCFRKRYGVAPGKFRALGRAKEEAHA